ncbi:MAG: hypothetical protein EA368_00870 [Leptolyngbya sp. DLM2.Bin27]|nr:MAG: hypothetical protein EA368_00870 [Leptolyngbya sp. DLM2.Bin27]
MIRWAIFGIYFVDLSTMLMRYYGGPELSVSAHAYSIWGGVYLVVYSLAILTGPPRQRRRKKLLQGHGRRRWIGQLAPIPA